MVVDKQVYKQEHRENTTQSCAVGEGDISDKRGNTRCSQINPSLIQSQARVRVRRIAMSSSTTSAEHVRPSVCLSVWRMKLYLRKYWKLGLSKNMSTFFAVKSRLIEESLRILFGF